MNLGFDPENRPNRTPSQVTKSCILLHGPIGFPASGPFWIATNYLLFRGQDTGTVRRNRSRRIARICRRRNLSPSHGGPRKNDKSKPLEQRKGDIAHNRKGIHFHWFLPSYLIAAKIHSINAPRGLVGCVDSRTVDARSLETFAILIFQFRIRTKDYSLPPRQTPDVKHQTLNVFRQTRILYLSKNSRHFCTSDWSKARFPN